MGTNMRFYKEKLEEYSEAADMSIDDAMIAITEAQGKLRAEMMRAYGRDAGTAQPAVLATQYAGESDCKATNDSISSDL